MFQRHHKDGDTKQACNDKVGVCRSNAANFLGCKKRTVHEVVKQDMD